jgi:hypothetical protein
MNAKTNPKVNIKKVQPYPISLKLEKAGVFSDGKIVKLTAVGFMAEMNNFFKVADQYKVAFDVPVVGESIQCSGKVIKTYDRYRDEDAAKKSIDRIKKPAMTPGPANSPGAAPQAPNTKIHLVEIHFLDLTTKQKDTVKRFLVAIGQK